MQRKITAIPKRKELIPKRKNVAAYARVSGGKDAMLHSLFAQVSYYSSYIQEHDDWCFAGVYADEALTGTKDSRPEFKRMIADCKAGKIDMIITKSISRFARNTVTLLETVRMLKEKGVDVYVHITIDHKDVNGEVPPMHASDMHGVGVNDLRRKELHLVYDNAVIMLASIVFEEVFCKFTGFLQANTGFYHFCAVPVLASRLQQHDLFFAFIVIISHHQCIGSL